MPYTKEYQKKYQKEYFQKNKDRLYEYNKQYREKNKEKLNIQKKEYGKTEHAKKTRFKYKYKMLVNCDLDILYNNYCAETHCDLCCMPFTEWNDPKYGNKYVKCLDHDHETNEFRNFLCFSCNVKRG